MNIDELPEGGVARVLGMAGASPELEAKLREIGFCEGDEVQLLTRGPLAGQPLAIRLNRRIIAMRSDEARVIEVEAAS
jgi:ferrous iron transport protein A